MTQTEQILEYLKQGYVLTPLEALQKFGCLRLGARIFELKQRGYNIKVELNKEGKHYAKYRLIQQEKP